MKRVVAACCALAALSLLGPAQPTYDPWAWIVWGREIVHGDLVTTAGPSWKPLPVLFTIPFGLWDDAAPQLWVAVARAGGLLAVVMAFRLGTRLAGRVAGLVAAAGLVLADAFVRNFARGNSEGLLVALCLWAVERHLDGRRAQAFVLGAAAGLLRPEVWPFLGIYGLWLMWREPARRPLVLGAGVVTVAAWLVPEYVGSGDWLRAADRAREANLDSPAHAASPFLEVFRQSAGVLPLALLLPALAALLWRKPVELALAGAAALLMVGVAVMTEAGFAGNLRYVALPAALVCVLSGVAWARAARRWALPVALLAVVGAWLALPWARDLGRDLRSVRSEADFVAQLDDAIALAGGPGAVRACGGIYTTRFQVPWVAWAAGVHLRDVGIYPFPPGSALAPRGSALSRDPRFPRVGETSKWVVRRACA